MDWLNRNRNNVMHVYKGRNTVILNARHSSLKRGKGGGVISKVNQQTTDIEWRAIEKVYLFILIS
jgi:hypothetical protein